VIEDAFVKLVHDAEPVRGREIDARLPALGFEFDAVLDRFLEHAFPP
jgi:hypothetical protein